VPLHFLSEEGNNVDWTNVDSIIWSNVSRGTNVGNILVSRGTNVGREETIKARGRGVDRPRRCTPMMFMGDM